MPIEIQQPKVRVGDIVCITQSKSEFVEMFAYCPIPSDCVFMPTITQDAYDALRVNPKGTYTVKELFMNSSQARKENEYSGAPGYLVLIEDTSDSRVRYLVEDWIVEKVPND